MPLRNRFDFRLSESREVCRFSCDDVLRNAVVMLLEKLRKILDRTALAGAMADQDDFVGGKQIFRHILVKCRFFRHTLTFVVGFLFMDQVVMKPERIVGAFRLLIFSA